MRQGILYIIATPIGNLGDISQRALEALSSVNLIAAEDTRHSKKLLQHYGISVPLVSLHGDNEKKTTQYVIDQLLSGLSVALISDAGTPLVSDPGRVLVEQAHVATVRVVPIPGPCAAIAALSASGFAADRFVFIGFLSTQKGARLKELASLKQEPNSLVFYEAPHRILQFVDELINVFGEDRSVVIARELTKQFETIKRDLLKNIKAWMQSDPNQERGEFVVIVQGNDQPVEVNDAQVEATLKVLLKELPLKQAVKLTSQITGVNKNRVYDLALVITSN